MLRQLVVASLFAVLTGILLAASPPRQVSTRPTVGLRVADASAVLLAGGDVVPEPGSPARRADVLIEGTSITAVGKDLALPAGVERIDVSGKTIYAGLIDAMHEVEVSQELSKDRSDYWNGNIIPESRAVWASAQNDAELKKIRSQGIAARVIAPDGGIIKGKSSVVLSLDDESPQRVLLDELWLHATLTVPRGKTRDRYPNSPMGATALVRQAFYDAKWYGKATRMFESNGSLSRPHPSVTLDSLANAIESEAFVFDAANERMALRSIDVAKEFSLQMILRGSGREYRDVEEIARSGSAVLVPVDFPKAPNTSTAESIRNTPLVDWMHWHFAPENPMRLHKAGVRFCLTTDSLEDAGSFLKQIRIAIQRGLDPEVAHAAVTTTPAELIGMRDQLGTVAAGKLANLVITDGELFDKETKVIETWVTGERFRNVKEESDGDASLVGTWDLKVPLEKKQQTLRLNLKPKEKTGLEGELRLVVEAKPGKEDSESKPKTAKLRDVQFTGPRMSASVDLGDLGEEWPSGLTTLTILVVDMAPEKVMAPEKENAPENNQEADVFASLIMPEHEFRSVAIRRVVEEKESESESPKENDADSVASDDEDETELPPSSKNPYDAFTHLKDLEVTTPLGAYGVSQVPVAPEHVLFRGATVWTCGSSGVLNDCDVLVRKGKIIALGERLAAPKGCQIVNAAGKHITPGLIDCHSHMGTDGGVNESGQEVTAEVRIGDFIDNSDISIYRQLAGGVTTANILHGSANPIGGQSQVVKLRWGQSMADMKLADAPAGIKFALGENVKRNQGRYPNTRMGVEQLLRDQFLAARQYEAEHQAWRNGVRDRLPPRRDLQMDAILEIQQGKRWVHCHSYRQDEITATLDVLEEFNVQIGTLQHILEGYKVADRIAEHGAMASSFADWWAYKFEVYDAIPYNGVLMHDAGVIVSFNSDDAELARHLNTEAAKATKYGGVPPEEALKFVTLNPAKQLRIDDRVGSIEEGKDADLVVWSGPPMSTTTRCEQTWVDGRACFSLAEDRRLRERDKRWHAALIQHAIASKKSEDTNKGDKGKSQAGQSEEADNKPDEVAEEDRWLRYDEFCGTGKAIARENELGASK